MLTKRIIPCLDVKGGRVVKGVQFLELRDAGDPVAPAAAVLLDRRLAAGRVDARPRRGGAVRARPAADQEPGEHEHQQDGEEGPAHARGPR